MTGTTTSQSLPYLDQKSVLSNLQTCSCVLQNAAGVFKEDKDLPGLMAATASVYEASAYLLGAGKVAPDPRRVVNISDQWARVEVGMMIKALVLRVSVSCQ